MKSVINGTIKRLIIGTALSTCIAHADSITVNSPKVSRYSYVTRQGLAEGDILSNPSFLGDNSGTKVSLKLNYSDSFEKFRLTFIQNSFMLTVFHDQFKEYSLKIYDLYDSTSNVGVDYSTELTDDYVVGTYFGKQILGTNFSIGIEANWYQTYKCEYPHMEVAEYTPIKMFVNAFPTEYESSYSLFDEAIIFSPSISMSYSLGDHSRRSGYFTIGSRVERITNICVYEDNKTWSNSKVDYEINRRPVVSVGVSLGYVTKKDFDIRISFDGRNTFADENTEPMKIRYGFTLGKINGWNVVWAQQYSEDIRSTTISYLHHFKYFDISFETKRQKHKLTIGSLKFDNEYSFTISPNLEWVMEIIEKDIEKGNN